MDKFNLNKFYNFFFILFLMISFNCIREEGTETINLGSAADIGAIPKHSSIISLSGGITLDFGTRVLWVFGTTELQQPDSNGYTSIPNSAAWIDKGPVFELSGFEFVLSGTGTAIQFIAYNAEELTYNSSNSGQIYLIPEGGIVINDTGYVFYKKTVIGPNLSSEDIGVGIASVDIDGNVTRITPGYYSDPVLFWKSPQYNWGEGAFLADDGMIYIFSNIDNGGLSGAVRMARVTAGNITDINSYQYWNKFEWNTTENQAVELFACGIQTSIFYNQYMDKYLAIYNNVLSNTITARTADALAGGWSIEIPLFNGRPPDIFSITDVRQHIIHQESGGKEILVSYSSKQNNISDVYIVRFSFK